MFIWILSDFLKFYNGRDILKQGADPPDADELLERPLSGVSS